MVKFLGKYSEYIYALLRIVAGWCFMLHGAQKLFGWFGGQQATETLMQVAGVVEFFGGLLIMVGLFASWAAFISSGQMAVAYFMAHVSQGGNALFPLLNRGEGAVLFCFIFLYVATKGAGKWSIASALGRPSLS